MSSPRVWEMSTDPVHVANMGQSSSSQPKHFSEKEIATIRRTPPALMDVRTVAAYLSQSERKTREDIRLRRIPHLKLGGKILVRLIDLQRALDALVIRES